MKKYHWIILMIGFLSFLASCMGDAQPSPTITIPSPTASVPPPSPTIPPSPTVTPAPTSTPGMPTLTSTPRPSPSPTSLPTYSPTQIEAAVKSALLHDPTCRLPCVFGITPGKTSWSEAMTVFARFGFRPGFVKETNGVKYYQAHGFSLNEEDYKKKIAIEPDFWIRGETILAIKVDSNNYDEDARAFREIWRHYSIREILQTYGKPSRVWLWVMKTMPEGRWNSPRPYYLRLFYDSQGFLIDYYGLSPFWARFSHLSHLQRNGESDETFEYLYEHIRPQHSPGAAHRI